ncbi:MAG: hypothetical protein DI537_34640 [Stutzerimonas stutzeri]|nr:MAG: hypothetical protein DI537_34640 [Stutzerimonas stutzeri]
MTDPVEQVARAALSRMRDESLNLNNDTDVWTTRGVPDWQAAIIRLSRPILMLVLGVGVMGVGTALVGLAEALDAGAGVRMAKAMADILKAYPDALYWLIAFMFGGQALAGIIRAWKS